MNPEETAWCLDCGLAGPLSAFDIHEDGLRCAVCTAGFDAADLRAELTLRLQASCAVPDAVEPPTAQADEADDDPVSRRFKLLELD